MKHLLHLVLFLLLPSLVLSTPIDPKIPSWVNKIDISSAGSINKKQVEEGYYYVLIDEQHNTLKQHSYFHYVTAAVTEESLTNVSQIEFSYDPAYQKVLLHEIKIHRGAEVINKINATLNLKILDEESQRNSGILNGRKTVYTNLSDVRKGDIIDYSYSVIGENPVMKNYFNFDLWLSHSVPVGKVYMRVVFPKDIVPTITNQNNTLKPLIRAGDVNDYIWEVNNPPIRKTESSIPAWYNPYARVQISNLKSWEEVKQHYKALLKLPVYNTASLKLIVDSAMKAGGIEDQITFAVGFVQTHVRYSGNENGIYSHVPRAPDYVLRNRFGDCKEKSLLLCEMLRMMNINAYPVLLNTALGNKIRESNPSVYRFDHCICNFKYMNQSWFIDPTISYQRGNFRMRAIPDYETGMVLDDNDTPFETIPTRTDCKEMVTERFKILPSGDATLDVTSRYSGSYADNTRLFFLTNSIYGIQDSYKDFYLKYIEEVKVADTLSYADNEETNEITVEEHYLLPKFWLKKNPTAGINRNFMPYSLHFKLNYGEENKRKDPLRISYPLNQIHTIIINKESGWNVTPRRIEEKNKFFDYSFAYDVNDKTVSLFYEFSSKMGVIEPEVYTDYKAKMDIINHNMVFFAQQNPLVNGTLGFNWLLLATFLAALLLAVILLWYLYRRPYKGSYENRYDAIGGWLIIVGIGLVINPLILMFTVFREYASEMNVSYAVFYFEATSAFFNPMKGYFTLFVCFFNTAMIVCTIFLAILFFQRKASFRPYYTIFRLINIAFLIFDVIVLYGYYGDSSEASERKIVTAETTYLIRSFFQACILVPYVWFSERSKHTFTVGNEAPVKTGEAPAPSADDLQITPPAP